MTERHAIERAIRDAGLRAPISDLRDLAGGCIHRVVQASLADDRVVVAKVNAAELIDLFEEERIGLEALSSTGTVLVPTPMLVGVFEGRAVLLMSALAPGRDTEAVWATFGRELAALHAAEVGSRYGFASDNHIGTTDQPNDWAEDWVEFNQEHRLGHQIALGGRRGVLKTEEIRRLEQLNRRLDDFLPRRPRPALLHGDLWTGNAMCALDGQGASRIGLIDPACSIGDGYADLAMMQLFGGFPPACFHAYAEVSGDGGGAARIAVYQLYHVLNHANLFGRGYAEQAMAIAGSLGF